VHDDELRPLRRGRSIAMTTEERDAFLAEARTVRVATVGSTGRPHVTPLWFLWWDGSLWLTTLTRSRRWAHLTQHPEVAAVIDAGDAYDELRGVEISGRAEPVGEAPRGSAPHPVLDAVEPRFAAKYGAEPYTPDGRHAWVAIRPASIVSWDFRKLPAGPR
jgi:nitroimidazol reductase NimA-like FMN-containing flavoprotein (pyridoxamine 5'-phosphate oxidase superfamily)